jgi:hypothetical protein
MLVSPPRFLVRKGCPGIGWEERQPSGARTISSAKLRRMRSCGEMDSTRRAWLRSNVASELPSIVGTELQAEMPNTSDSAIEHCVNVPSNFTCHLTLELSGGVAVRLERFVSHQCDATCTPHRRWNDPRCSSTRNGQRMMRHCHSTEERMRRGPTLIGPRRYRSE